MWGFLQVWPGPFANFWMGPGDEASRKQQFPSKNSQHLHLMGGGLRGVNSTAREWLCTFSAATKQQANVYGHSMKLCCYDYEFHYMWAASLQSCQNQNAWKRRVLGRCLHMQLLPATVSIQITYISRVSIKAMCQCTPNLCVVLHGLKKQACQS